MLEIDNRTDFDDWCRQAERPPAAIQNIDLSDLDPPSLVGNFAGCLFLACDIPAETSARLVLEGAVVLPPMPHYLFSVHRAYLYSVDELFAGFDPASEDGYHECFDARVHRQYKSQGGANPTSIYTSLARRLHDHSITDALMETIADKKVVAVMGGHGMNRADAHYARVARISRDLTRRGYTLVSGGGPGAMEATHLGAYFAPRDDNDLSVAIEILSKRPPGAGVHEYKDKDWLHRAWSVRAQFPIARGKEAEALSIGIPTWLYGHEPPAPFATHFAKYFANSVREDGLLAIATYGIIFAPGSAGTTQEIFQDAAQNHYSTAGVYSPMILLDREFWTTTRPVWPLLEKVSRSEAYGQLVEISDDEHDIVRRICDYDPTRYSKKHD